jgi:hypothetical protein
MPVLALRAQAALRISGGSVLQRSQQSPPAHKALYNGPMPTLIPAEMTPDPAWVDLQVTSYLDGVNILGDQLAACPPVTDERIRTAIELAIASRYDTLPRSIFLSQLTIIDSLAIRGDRSDDIQSWLDQKIEEAKGFNDQGIITSLEQLKAQSHGSAVRMLVGRAARARGEETKMVSARQRLATKLYKIRSGLSHATNTSAWTSEIVEEARQLASFVLNSAIDHPAILTTESIESAS